MNVGCEDVDARQVGRDSLGHEGLVYTVVAGGHRQSYVDLLGPMFGLEPVVERMSFALFRRLVAADRLLLASLDDHMLSFGAIAALRSARGRPTAALFLRAQKCFDTGRWRYAAKRWVFRLLRRLPRLTIAAITPFSVMPAYAQVAHVGVCDPQYWDKHNERGERELVPDTDLSRTIQHQAGTRAICCALGSLSAEKGLGFLAETLELHPHIAEHTIVVCAGRVAHAHEELAGRLAAAGALVLNRFLSNAEMESLYSISDSIWACYAPGYDQASGVFGRAIQMNVPVIVRSGSVIARFADQISAERYAASPHDHAGLAQFMRRPSSREARNRTPDRARGQQVAAWRQDFTQALLAAMTGAPQVKARPRNEGTGCDNASL